MEYWQFFLQQEGETSDTDSTLQSWHPVTTPKIEVIAGKYGVIARTSLINTDVEIRITYQGIGEKPLLRKYYQRLRRTNAEGLIAILPFTDLKAGTWELDCTGQQMPGSQSQFANFGWRQNLKIEVWPSGDKVESPEKSPQLESQESSLPCFLSLESENLVASQGQSITVSGQVSPAHVSSLDSVFSGKLRMEIREPHDSQILRDVEQELSADSLPLRFSLPMTLPSNLPTHLLLGEVTLMDAQERVLATEGFKITIEIEQLCQRLIPALPEFPPPIAPAAPQSSLMVSFPPTPELILPPGILKAGESLRAIVKLPSGANSMSVRLWVQDCQTRFIVDGPYWLEGFYPRGSDFIEAIIELTVPNSSREIQLTAVTFDPDNHRESYKAIVDRSIK
ncbi:MAG: hypothetical protein KME17_12900 [Cyanosarcina radialis HA8281-LM2]|jgi:hypothetical protein|nr:hypothetical protein [Cyanosarcina radialis HA8281-LM2]